jgi:uridine phosphorylase
MGGNEQPVDKSAVGIGGRQYHVRVAPGEIGDVALMPGDPFRVQLIADRLTDVGPQHRCGP